jgi:murein DD-endopeptidase MepM/ murein hydrolase activator NlpD
MALRRLLPVAVVAVIAVAAAPASGDVISRKQTVDARLQEVQAKISRAEDRERALVAELASVNRRIRGLEARAVDVTAGLISLERDLALHREKLGRLNDLYRLQTARLDFLRDQYQIALERLENRLVDLYEGGEPSAIEVIVSSTSLSDMISQAEFVESVGNEDHRIAEQVGDAKADAHAQRDKTKRIRVVVASETRTIAVRTAQVRAVRDALLASEHQLAAARRSKHESLLQIKESKQEFLHEAAGLEQASAALAAQIQSAQASSAYSPPGDTTPSAAGLIWPVNGPVVSPFGMRWGRMHEGIDIAVPEGTPIHAAAAGRVVYSGWMSGYGNLVAIDHGNGLSTAYAHQSSIAAGVGETVSQGQVIGYVGCTGHCFGPHLHFEVRVNGTPVDPLGYL